MLIRPRTIYVIPMGEIPAEYLEIVADSITDQFGLQVQVAPDQGPPQYALDTLRQQYNSNLILKNWLKPARPTR